MSTDTVIRPPDEIATLCEFGPEPLALIGPGISYERALARLREKQHFAEAVALLAHGLPIALGIAWGLECVPQGSVDLSPQARDALQASEQWVQEPNDSRRREAFAAANKVGFDTPAGCLGFAVFLSGGSVAPAGLAEVLPNGPVAARALAGAIQMATLGEGAVKAPEKFGRFLDAGAIFLTRANAQR